MDDIGNILYILLILLSVIFSAFRKKKKPTVPPPSPEQKQRPQFDPMKELETFLEKFEDEKKPQEKEVAQEMYVEEDEEIEVLEKEIVEEKNPYMQHLDDRRFQEAAPQTFSDDLLISDDINDVTSQLDSGTNEIDAAIKANDSSIFNKQVKKRKMVLKNFNAKDAIIYSAIINRPYQ
jgi:hypothetical protein